MKNEALDYLPLATSILSVITALAVAFIGVRNSKNIEASKAKVSYLNYAFQKLMDEYMKYDPVVNLSEAKDGNYLRLIEDKFCECRSLIVRVSPLVDHQSLELLRKIEIQHVSIIRDQHNASIAGREIAQINADDYAALLTEYINLGHSVIQSQIAALRHQLEEAR